MEFCNKLCKYTTYINCRVIVIVMSSCHDVVGWLYDLRPSIFLETFLCCFSWTPWCSTGHCHLGPLRGRLSPPPLWCTLLRCPQYKILLFQSYNNPSVSISDTLERVDISIYLFFSNISQLKSMINWVSVKTIS